MYVDKRTSGSGPVPQGCRAGPRDPGTRGRGQAGSARPRQIAPEGGSMSTLPAVTTQDLELEHAELLPSRETLNCCRNHGGGFRDRKSTRLNSSHVKISYAVFCLKKK